MKKIAYLLPLFLGGCLFSTGIKAQNMNSPYSVYGIGDLDFRFYNRSSGMGHTGIAVHAPRFIMDNNPAAISRLPVNALLFHVGMSGKVIHFSGDPVPVNDARDRDFGVEQLALGMKLNRVWAGSLGFKKLSRVNYRMKGERAVEGSLARYGTYNEGDGGLNDFYWTNALTLSKALAIGLKTSLITGSIHQTEVLSDASFVLQMQKQHYYTGARFEFGMQYDQALPGEWTMAFGAKMAAKTKLALQQSMTVRENDSTIVNQKFIRQEQFSLPAAIGLGIAVRKGGKTFALDYSFDNWASLGIRQEGWRLDNSNRLSMGMEVSNYKSQWNQVYESSFWQLGGFTHATYLTVHQLPIREWGITAGRGGQLKNSSLAYALAVEGGTRGTVQNGLIREQFFRFTFCLSYGEMFLNKKVRYN